MLHCHCQTCVCVCVCVCVRVPLIVLTSSLQIIFLGKIADELFLKVVELKKIQGNVQLGAMKCQTREFLSFCPMVCEGVRV